MFSNVIKKLYNNQIIVKKNNVHVILSNENHKRKAIGHHIYYMRAQFLWVSVWVSNSHELTKYIEYLK